MNKIILIALISILAAGLIIILLFISPPQTIAPPEQQVHYKQLIIPPLNLPSCIGESELIPESLQIPCCQGLSEIISQQIDPYGGCPAEEFPIGEHFCTACGNGECGLRETPCSCPQDCMQVPASRGNDSNETASLNSLRASILQTFSTYYPENFSAYSSSGEDLFIWLKDNDPALLRDLIASTQNPAGIEPYLRRWEVFTQVSESYARQILQTAIGKELSNVNITDSGTFWSSCASHGTEGSITRTCCRIPKEYGPGSQLSCS